MKDLRKPIKRIRIILKTLLFCVVLFFSISSFCFSQDGFYVPKKNSIYESLGIKMDHILTTKNGGNINTFIPYKTTDSLTKTRTESVLKSSIANPFIKEPIFLSVLYEYEENKNSFNFQLGGALNYSNSLLFNIGYGRVYSFNLSKEKNTKITIKGFLNIMYFNIGVLVDKIDNRNKYVNINDYTFNPTFRAGGKHPSKYFAQDINVYYEVSCWAFNPQLVIANDRIHEVFWAVNIGYLIPYYNLNQISFIQKAGRTSGKAKSFEFKNTDAFLNGNSINNTPFSFDGFNIGFAVGICFGKK
jgi:hypothetical protein